MHRISVAIAVVLFLAACVTVHPPAAAPSAPAVTAPPATPASGKKEEEKPPFKPWKEVLKDTRAIDGLFRTHLKRDQTLFMEIAPEQLDHDFGLVMHLSRGISDYGLNNGLPLTEMRLVRFHRVGDRVQLIHLNPRFTAEAASPMRLAVDQNVGHSVIGSFRIESQDSVSKALLLDLSPWLVSDYGEAGEWLKQVHARKPVGLDKERSAVARVLGFPRNLEVDVQLTYTAAEAPPFNPVGVSDWRSIPVGVRYSLVALPEVPMRPRLGDPRVGYFLDAVRDFSRDGDTEPFRTYINRWRLEKKDPTAAVSEPITPIVFYIDATVPREYRAFVKEGIEAWDKGFERAGFRNAIVAREAPANDSTWSAEDARYSTVRWSADPSGWAIGPSQTDPRTGEILNADILITSGFVRYLDASYREMVASTAMGEEMEGAQALRSALPRHLADRLCMAEAGARHQLGVQHTLLAGLGMIDGTRSMPVEYLGDALRDLVMHEVGHTLGLRHNFKSSSAVPYERLNDREFTRQNGMATSVMDYLAVNISPDPKAQGYFTNPEIGAYDVWAIEYGYTPLAAAGYLDERPELQRIAGRSAEPLLAYNTDEDTHLGPWSVDPSSSTWDLGSDPIRFARDRRTLINRALPVLEERIIAPGQPYDRLRTAVSSLIRERYRSLVPLTKLIGGLHFARDLRGDPGARPPFTPVPAARQREAVRLVVDEAFSPSAFHFEPALLNKLPPARLSHWNTQWFATPIDFPIHREIGAAQSALLQQLLHPARLQRMLDNELRMPDGEPYQAGELMQALGGTIWGELDGQGRAITINSVRRNLQREHLSTMTRLLLGNAGPAAGPAARVPEHARSLGRLELSELATRIDAALASPGLAERDTRAHLLESRARIDQSLEAALHLAP